MPNHVVWNLKIFQVTHNIIISYVVWNVRSRGTETEILYATRPTASGTRKQNCKVFFGVVWIITATVQNDEDEDDDEGEDDDEEDEEDDDDDVETKMAVPKFDCLHLPCASSDPVCQATIVGAVLLHESKGAKVQGLASNVTIILSRLAKESI